MKEVTVRLEEQDLARFDQQAAYYKVSRAEVIRRQLSGDSSLDAQGSVTQRLLQPRQRGAEADGQQPRYPPDRNCGHCCFSRAAVMTHTAEDRNKIREAAGWEKEESGWYAPHPENRGNLCTNFTG